MPSSPEQVNAAKKIALALVLIDQALRFLGVGGPGTLVEGLREAVRKLREVLSKLPRVAKTTLVNSAEVSGPLARRAAIVLVQAILPLREAAHLVQQYPEVERALGEVEEYLSIAAKTLYPGVKISPDTLHASTKVRRAMSKAASDLDRIAKSLHESGMFSHSEALCRVRDQLAEQDPS